MKLLLTNMQRRYLVGKTNKIYVSDGVIELNKAKPGKPIKTHLGKEYYILEPEFNDLLIGAKRGPQVILPKDVGAILTHTNINRKSLCIDAGTGSGWLAMQLARFVKQVITYEQREEHAKIAKENFRTFGLKNIKLKRKDATKGFSERNADLITLDMLNPEEVPFAKSLRIGAYCVACLPHIEQALQFIRKLPEGVKFDKMLVTRVYPFDSKGGKIKLKVRHTAYLVFVRKVF